MELWEGDWGRKSNVREQRRMEKIEERIVSTSNIQRMFIFSYVQRMFIFSYVHIFPQILFKSTYIYLHRCIHETIVFGGFVSLKFLSTMIISLKSSSVIVFYFVYLFYVMSFIPFKYSENLKKDKI